MGENPNNNKYPPEIAKMRHELAVKIGEKRQARDASKKKSESLTSQVTGTAKNHFEAAQRFKTRAQTDLAEGRERIDLALANWQVDFETTGNTKTDQSLVQWYYKRFRHNAEAHPVATDTFIDKSRSEYNAAWLTRELVQNFVDHNPDHPGTLDGVTLDRQEELNGMVRFSITGNWKFEDPTGVISPHSEKPEGVNTAGGNGIGLKQTAIRLERDFGVKRFEIQGENWKSNYELAKKDQINQRLGQAFRKAGKPQSRSLRHDWLVVELQETVQKDKCAYVIETDNPELINALSQFEQLGVSEHNEYLRSPDFKNQDGTIKWLHPKHEGQVDRGRLFINGQVMNYGSKGETSADYWVGPEFVTIQLNNVEYQISVDRPPVRPYELSRYLRKLVESMTSQQAIEQLQKSEPIWVRTEAWETGAEVLIKDLVRKLQWSSDYKSEMFSQYFGHKKYLALSRRVTIEQQEKLIKRGFVLCPSYFESIGMPKAEAQLTDLEAAQAKMPDQYAAKRDLERIAEENGIQVAYEDLSKVKSEQLFAVIQDRLASLNPEVAVDPEVPNKVKIKLDGAIPSGLLSSLLINPTTDEQKLLYFIRGMAFQGLQKGIFKKIFLSQGEYLTTFANEYDLTTSQATLFIRNNKAPSDEGVFIELEVDEKYQEQLSKAFGYQKVLVEAQVGLPPDLRQEQIGAGEALVRVQAPTGADLQTLQSVAVETGRTSPALIHLSSPGEALTKRPPGQESGQNGNIRVVPVGLTQEAFAVAQKLEQHIPNLVDAAVRLQSALPKENPEPHIDYRLAMYQALKDSGELDKVAVRNSRYLGGRSLIEILNQYSATNVPGVVVIRQVTGAEKGLEAVSRYLMHVANKFKPTAEMVHNDFEIELNPTERQLTQLGLLRMYVALATEAEFENTLFIFKGSGARAINIQNEAIGLHEEILQADFMQAVGALIHEVARNEVSGNGPKFVGIIQALHARAEAKLLSIINKQARNIDLDDEEKVLQAVYTEWNRLR